MRRDRHYAHSYDLPFQRDIYESDLRSSTNLFPTKRRDPIFTPLFTALFTSIGFSATTAATLAGLATAITVTAISIGIQALLAPKPPKPEDGKAPKVQSVPYRQWCVGRNRLAGAYMLWDARGKYLYSVQAMAGHKVHSFNRYWLHSDEVEIDGSGTTTNDDNGRYGNNVNIQTRLGAVPETPYARFVADLAADGVWTNNHRGDGQASAAMVCESTEQKNQQKRFPFGAPQLSCEVDGAHVFDPRDGTQNVANPATWKFSRNAALIMLWHQCHNPFGHRRDYNRAILPVLNMWIEEANVCDEAVALKGGGTEPRYECNGFDTTENDPKAATNAILASCDGWLSERGDGALLLTVGKYREDRVVEITDADVTGYQVAYDVLFEDEINRIVPKFCYPEIGYGTSDTDYFEDSAAQLVAGRVLSQEADYRWVQRWRQARRLGKRDWLRVQERVSGTLNVRMSGINAVHARWIRMRTPLSLPRLDGLLIENRRSTMSLLQGGYQMEFVKNPVDIDAWNPVVDEGQQPPVPQSLSAEDIPTPVINLVQAKPYNDSVYVKVKIVDPVDTSLTPILRYRLTDAGGGVPGQWVEVPFPGATSTGVGGYIDLNTANIYPNALLDIQVAFQGSNGSYGPWSVTTQVVTVVDPTAPIALLSFTSDAAPRLGRTVLSFVTGNDAHLSSVKIFRVAHGGSFDPATAPLVAQLSVGPNGTYSYTDGDATRVNSFLNPGFDTDTSWTKSGTWTISGGTANTTGGSALLYQQPTVTNSQTYRYGYSVTAVTTPSTGVQPFIAGGTPVYGTARTAVGTYREKIVNNASGNFALGFVANGSFTGSIDNAYVFQETVTCAPQGDWDYYISTFNGSDVIGPSSGPLNVQII